MLNEILLIFLLLAGLFYWSHFHQIWEMALNSAKARCRLANVQMLDDYVAIKKSRLARDRFGNRQLRHTFGFEFTATGYDRYQGRIVFLGRQLESFYMEPHRIETTYSAARDSL